MSTILQSTIVPLDDLAAAEELQAGGKAYNCARLKQAGFRVPDGLIVLAGATGDELAALPNHPWFDALPSGTLFAVRSSGIGEDGGEQSFAGIHQTLLDVSRSDLACAVAECRESAHSAPAVEYRRAKGIPADAARMAVLIQVMIHPVAAGVAFTMNPVTGAGDEIVINSSWGLAEALVSGHVDPDEFVIRKQDRSLVWSRAGDKGGPSQFPVLSLSNDQAQELARIVSEIETRFGTPQDVEWCHDGAGFWIVQSRPVTTARPDRKEIEWTRANVAEVLPDMTSPQALAAFEDLLNRAQRQYVGRLMGAEQTLGPMAKSFNGRLYFNLTQARRVCAMSGMAAAEMLRSMGHAGVIEAADEKPVSLPFRERMSGIPDLMRILLSHLRVRQIMRRHESRMARDLSRFAADPRQLSDNELWNAIEHWYRDVPDYMQIVLLLTGVLFHEMPVRKACEKTGFSFERLVYPQLGAGERSVSAQQAFDLIALADRARREAKVLAYLTSENADLSAARTALQGTEFLAHLDKFLGTYGHRGRYESDWSLPRYSEDPSPLLHAIRAHLESGPDGSSSETAARQEREAAETWREFARRLPRWRRPAAVRRIRRSIRNIKHYYIWREQVRSDLMLLGAHVRQRHLILAERFVERGWLDGRNDYFLVRLQEIEEVIRGHSAPESLRALAVTRRLELTRYRTIQMPLLMRESELPSLIRTAGVSGGPAPESELTGYPVSGGCVEAEVVVIHDPGDFDRMKRGAILVAPATDPSWTPLFTLASGVIVEVGGVLSHASTVAREYGLPAIANVKHATRRLRTGQRVRLDANNGLIQRL